MKNSPKVGELRGNEAWQHRVGGAVRAARTEMRLTQTALGLRSGVEYATISRLEKGKTIPTLPVLEALADALFISIDKLVGHTVAQPEKIGDGLAPDQRALLQQRMQAEIDSFLRTLPPERLVELSRPTTPQPPPPPSAPEPVPRSKVVSRRRSPRPESP